MSVTDTNTPPAPPPGGNPPSAPPVWYAEVQDTALRGWVEAKGFKSLPDAVQSHHNLERLLGHDRAGNTVVLPKDGASPEELAAFYDKVGRPKDPALYDVGEEDPEVAGKLRKVLHEAGLRPDQAKALREGILKITEEMKSVHQATDKTVQATRDTERVKLVEQWGAEKELKRATHQAGVKSLGVTEEQYGEMERVLGVRQAMEIALQAGSKLMEAPFVAGKGHTLWSPEGAAARLRLLERDPGWVRAFQSGDASARAQWDELTKASVKK